VVNQIGDEAHVLHQAGIAVGAPAQRKACSLHTELTIVAWRHRHANPGAVLFWHGGIDDGVDALYRFHFLSNLEQLSRLF
jgi:hypothetical protein